MNDLSPKAQASLDRIKAKLRFIEAANRILAKEKAATQKDAANKSNSINLQLAAGLRGEPLLKRYDNL